MMALWYFRRILLLLRESFYVIPTGTHLLCFRKQNHTSVRCAHFLRESAVFLHVLKMLMCLIILRMRVMNRLLNFATTITTMYIQGRFCSRSILRDCCVVNESALNRLMA